MEGPYLWLECLDFTFGGYHSCGEWLKGTVGLIGWDPSTFGAFSPEDGFNKLHLRVELFGRSSEFELLKSKLESFLSRPDRRIVTGTARNMNYFPPTGRRGDDTFYEAEDSSLVEEEELLAGGEKRGAMEDWVMV